MASKETRFDKRRRLNALLDRLDHMVDMCGWEKEEPTEMERERQRLFTRLQKEADKLTRELEI